MYLFNVSFTLFATNFNTKTDIVNGKNTVLNYFKKCEQ